MAKVEVTGNTAKKSVKSVKRNQYPHNSGKLRFMAGRDIPIYILLSPAVILLLIFHYLPIYGIVMGFQNYSPFKGIGEVTG